MERLLYFPEPFPDEDFRSIIFRYHIRTGNSEMNQTKKELFGVHSDKVGHIPRNLMNLINKLPGDKKTTAEEIISYTWYPFFKKFLSYNRKEAVENDILYGSNNKGNYASKIVMQRNSPIILSAIKYCPQCIREDYQIYGEVYLHLSHQLSFLQFCPKHLVRLTERCPLCNKPFSKPFASFLISVPCCQINVYGKIEVNKIVELQLFLLREVLYIKDNIQYKSFQELYTKIISILNKKGYITLGGIVKKSQLIDDFLSHYPEEFLNLIGISKKKIFTHLLNKSVMVRIPLVYILLICYLKGSLQNFLEEDEDAYSMYIPFGNGPWFCINNVCPSYNNYYPILKCKRRVEGEYIIVKFFCPECGCEFTRRWNKNKPDGNKVSVVSRGWIWIKKVMELKESGYTSIEIAEKVNSGKNIIDYHLRKEELIKAHIEVAATLDTCVNKFDNTRKTHREKILQLINSHPRLNRNKVQKLAKKEYTWVLKNDTEWFNSILPPSKGGIQLNYAVLDNELRVKVIDAAQLIYKLNPSTQIKRFSILNKLMPKDKNRIVAHLNKLPRTLEELEKYEESKEDYQVRHIPKLVSQLKSSGYVNVTFNSILSFRRSYRNCSEETKKRIEETLISLQECDSEK